jgi:NTP pyrophosphatase (non-canonical NTP hydrolase)
MTPEQYIKDVLTTESMDFSAIRERLGDHRTIRLLHALMGLQTEAAELTDALKKYLFYGKPLDYPNLLEEIGDLEWYKGLLLDVLQVSQEHVWDLNLKKLKLRYAGKFGETAAIDRDLATERAVFEEEEE